jgi:hypothetical protein
MRISPCLLIVLTFLSCRVDHKNIEQPKGKTNILSVPNDSTAFYFPLKKARLGSKNHDQALDSSVNSWYSPVLYALREPILFNYSGSKEIYRFTYIPSMFNYPVAVKIFMDCGISRMSVRADRSSMRRGNWPTIIDTTFIIKPEEWSSFLLQLDKISFWTLQAEIQDGGLDGSEWILEGVKNGTYHFATRWSPYDRHPEYRDCCEYLRLLAVKSVDFHGEY